jgi:hypothetical protein
MDNTDRDNDRSQAVYRRIKRTIDEAYPKGWLVAIADDEPVTAAADFRELEGKLRAQGRDPRAVLVVEAGMDYPEYVTVFV